MKQSLLFSLVATAYFMKDNFDTPDTELANVIHNLKPRYTAEYIQSVLERGGVTGEGRDNLGRR